MTYTRYFEKHKMRLENKEKRRYTEFKIFPTPDGKKLILEQHTGGFGKKGGIKETEYITMEWAEADLADKIMKLLHNEYALMDRQHTNISFIQPMVTEVELI
jgi:hypothetical protein